MSPRTYRAETMALALAKVKHDLGNNAVILQTRSVKLGGVLGVGGRTAVEITARCEPRLPRPARRAPATTVAEAPAPPPPAPAPPADADGTARELRQLKSAVQALLSESRKASAPGLPPELRGAYIRLIQNEVAEELAGELIARLGSQRGAGETLDPATVHEFLVQQIARLLAPGCPIRLRDDEGARVVALVGPTGVGKTTTIAKLAAHYGLNQGRRIGLVTVDTQRIGGAEQLRTYARILDVPCEVVYTAADLNQALARMWDRDVIFIDTSGHNPGPSAGLEGLKQLLATAQPDEVHLVLSANNSRAALLRAVDGFAGMDVDRVIFTKIDETVGAGTLLSVMDKIDARLSYITTGQRVPDDIEVGDGRRLAQWILQGGAPPAEDLQAAAAEGATT